MNLVSIIIPVHNEEKNIPEIYKKVSAVFEPLKNNYNHEIIFVNDGSTDNSAQEIEKITSHDGHVKFLEFSRNFGKEIATSAGIHHAKGDAVIMIDADLQHPPELILEFIKKWENGGEVIVGVREKNKGEGLIKKLGSFFFYKIMNAIGDTKIAPNSTDFRLLDRKVVDEFNKLSERNRMTRGLIAWLGFKREFIPFHAEERKSGKAAYNTIKLIRLATTTFISNSLFPLRIAGYLGIFITCTSVLLGIFAVSENYLFADPFSLRFSGTFMLGLIITFLIGIVLICLGIIALYIAHIRDEVLDRPMYVIRKKNVESSMQ